MTNYPLLTPEPLAVGADELRERLRPFQPLTRQHRLLSYLLPTLIRRPWTLALALSGSLAQGSGDSWSSVDLHLILTPNPGVRLITIQQEAVDLLTTRLNLEAFCCPDEGGVIRGLSLGEPVNAAIEGGVTWSLRLHPLEGAASLSQRFGPLYRLYAVPHAPWETAEIWSGDTPNWSPGQAQRVHTDLRAFWLLLARLPAAVNRGEHLAALHLLTQARMTLIDLVAALNGVNRPDTPLRINPFLGPAQREAFERSATLTAGLSAESWIGQAVALLVLYRWYAPQLVEMYALTEQQTHLARLERSVLAHLSAQISGWPARIQTG
jgi:hypothetical protein